MKVSKVFFSITIIIITPTTTAITIIIGIC